MNQEGCLNVVGRNIKKYRRARKLTLEDLAWQVGMEKPDIHNIEAGKRNITVKNLVKISEVLDIPAYQLLID